MDPPDRASTRPARGLIDLPDDLRVLQAVSNRQLPPAEQEPFDLARWCRAVLFGGVFYPVLAHYHYNFLE